MPNILKRTLFGILAAFLLLTLLTYFYRYPTGDDAWFGEQSYWLEKTGIIRSEFFRGLLGWERQILVSHKLFLFFGAMMIRIFGYHLPVLQFTGFIFFCILVFELLIYVKKREQSLWVWYLPAFLILIFANRLLVKMSFENRPEMMLAALGFGSFLLLNGENKRLPKTILAGILAGMTFLCHLNGAIFLVAGFVTLLYTRHDKHAIAFAIAGSFTIVFYWIDVVQAQVGFATWYYQFSNDPATQDALGWYSKLIQLVTYPRLFFHSPEQIAPSLLLTFMLWHQRKYLAMLPVKLRIYSLTLFLSFWLITKANGALYLTFFMPFMIVLIYELYKIRPFENLALKVILAAYLVVGAFGMIQIIQRNFTMEYLPFSYKRLRPEIDNKQTGFVPLTFFFNEYEEYPRLLTHENYKLQSKKKGMTTAKMANWAHNNGADFIVMDYKFRPEPYYPKAGVKTIPFYKLAFFDGRFAIYKR
ncbi:hypothetical protein [Dyadobacter arcticus]|uniref:Glycosyltransferase RgtA/B/C/D-like domain-containing protein n=1 Tax=Dyadobacter arcticus TaxID=1078754 RepID=A0ABX0UQI2_9BACT|nr:hypothetical protein [Dyadobacter arcticus]NIJ55253.1 hypothetical protein [Dyadobacter arcticus]